MVADYKRVLELVFKGDSRNLQTATGGADRAMGGLATNSKKMGGAMKAGIAGGAAAAGTAVVVFGKQALEAAGDAQQARRNLDLTFGPDLADMLAKTGEEAAQRFGIPAREFENMAADMGTQLQALGIDATASADLVDPLTTRLADLAAKSGGDASEAMAALGSLMRGERDPIEKYGVALKQSDINARLAADGLGHLEGEALKQAEAQASLALFMEQTTSSVGAFDESQDTLAGRMQVTSARFEDVKAKAGQFLSEGLVKVWDWSVKNLPVWWAKVQEWAGHVIDAFTWARDMILPVWNGIWRYIEGFVQVLQGLIQFIRGVFSGDWSSAWNGILKVFSGIWDQVKAVFEIGWAGIQAVWNGIIAGATWAVNVIKDAVVGTFRGMWDAVKAVFRGAVSFVTAPFKAAAAAIKSLWNNSIGGKGITIPDIPGLPGRGRRFEIPRLAAGGIVTGPPSPCWARATTRRRSYPSMAANSGAVSPSTW